MFYEAELSFFQSFVKKLQLDCFLITPDTDPLPTLDHGLRKLLRLQTACKTSPEIFSKGQSENIVYKVTDDFFCRYIFLPLPDRKRDTVLMVGPYTNTGISDQTVMKLVQFHSLPADLYPHLVKYYSRIPIIWDDAPLMAALEVLSEKIWGGPEHYSIRSVEYRELGQPAAPSQRSYSFHSDSASYSMEVLELRYQLENQLLKAIYYGQTQKAEAVLSQMPWGLIEPRTPDSNRNLKNYMIILNTLMRKTVEQSSVHPLHIDHLSGYFAGKIELISHHSDTAHLAREMVHKYCLLVQNHSLKAYSLPVRKVITNIDYDLTADLGLKAQAKLLKVNPSYLSSLFKKETGVTLTDYVNQKRVSQAILLLNSTAMQVQTIAQLCGIGDVNYFSKIFKKIVGKTPVEYRKNITFSAQGDTHPEP